MLSPLGRKASHSGPLARSGVAPAGPTRSGRLGMTSWALVSRTGLAIGLLGLGVGVGCSLLDPYPGGGSPVDALKKDGAGIEGSSEDPLLDPATDSTVTITSELDSPVVALPGTGFPIKLTFIAENENVVGGGIRLPGSDEVQWTFTSNVMNQPSGTIEFRYLLPADVCEDVANLCHEIPTEQFAVTRNLDSGEYEVSEPEEITVVLQCATCTSASCAEVLPPGACMTCTQPDSCLELYEACYAPGAPSEGTETADLFEVFLGENGILWSSADGCFNGTALCQGVLDGGSCDL